MKDRYLTPHQKLESVAELAFKATKGIALAEAVQARFSESLEAVNSLPKSEKGIYVEQVRRLFHDRVKAYAEAFGMLTDFLKMADDAPDFVMKEHQPGVEKIRAFHAGMLEQLAKIQPKLSKL